jgi:hypothetical protein
MKPRILLAAAGLAAASACGGKASGGRDAPNTASPPGGTTTVSGAIAPRPEVTSVPASIDALGHHGENVYDMVKAGNWVAARASADSLHLMIDSVPGAATIAFRELNQAIASRNRVAALRAANRLTELGALLSQPYHPSVPAEVMLLDYQGRELEIWAGAADTAMLRRTGAMLRRTWTTVRPQVVARGGSAPAVRFDTLVTRVEAATTPAQYARLATPVLDAVDSLELVFTP